MIDYTKKRAAQNLVEVPAVVLTALTSLFALAFFAALPFLMIIFFIWVLFF